MSCSHTSVATSKEIKIKNFVKSSQQKKVFSNRRLSEEKKINFNLGKILCFKDIEFIRKTMRRFRTRNNTTVVQHRYHKFEFNY